MGYIKDYDELLTKEGYEKIKEIIDNGNVISDYQPLEITLKEHDGLKYFSLIINTEGRNVNFGAYLLVSYQEKKDLFSCAHDEEIFPVMFIVSPSELDKKAYQFHNETITLNHELMHLKDLKEIFEKEPSFIDKGFKNALSNITDFDTITAERLTECIDYAVEKNFRIEPQAMKSDFESGEHRIIIPFESDYIVHECKNCSEYIKLSMLFYVSEIKFDLQEKIKSNVKMVTVANESFISAITRYGKLVFGENTYRNFEAAGKEIAMVVLKHLK